MLTERDKYLNQVRQLVTSWNKLQDDKKNYIRSTNDRIEQLEKNLAVKEKSLELVKEELQKMTKISENFWVEWDRLKLKIIKMKNRRIKTTNIEEKMCKKC